MAHPTYFRVRESIYAEFTGVEMALVLREAGTLASPHDGTDAHGRIRRI